MPADVRAYAFGDVHGRRDLLARLLDMIERDASQHPGKRKLVIGLGDYVDRGPDANGVLSLLCAESGDQQELIALRGNHEEVLLKFLEHPDRDGPLWIGLDGLSTLRSYGIHPSERALDFRRLRDELIYAMPPEHLSFLRGTVVSYRLGGYFFSHAGAREGVPLSAQSSHDLLWFRTPPDRVPAFECTVVHGHQPVRSPAVRGSTVNIDTGAYATGRLTCAVFDAAGYHFFSVTKDSEPVTPV
jgi:serine/threonine protein phosphatase 1